MQMCGDVPKLSHKMAQFFVYTCTQACVIELSSARQLVHLDMQVGPALFEQTAPSKNLSNTQVKIFQTPK